MGTKTIKSSGGDYTSLSAWEAAEQADITGLGPSIAECYDVDDTTPTTISGWTTTASDYIEIIAATAARCNGSTRAQTTDTYRLSGSNGNGQLRIAEDYVRVSGIEIKSTGAQPALEFPVSSIGSPSDIRIEDCVLITSDSSASTDYAVRATEAGLTLLMRNCLVVGKRRGTDTRNSTAVTIDHCIFFGDGASLGLVSDTELTCTNTYVGEYATQDFWTGGASPSGSHNASADTTATTDYTSSLTSKAAADQFVSPSITDSTFDFSLKSGNDLEGAGTGSITNDIAGNAYGSPSDIGCFAPVGGSTYTLTAETGAYSLGSDAVNLTYDRVLSADAQTYTLGSDAVNLTYSTVGSYTLTADVAAYSLGSDSANLLYDPLLSAGTATYTLGSDAVNLTYNPVGSYTLSADLQTYTVGSDAVNLVYDRIFTVEPTAYTFTGGAALLTLGVLDTPNCYTWLVSQIEDVVWFNSVIDGSANYKESEIDGTAQYTVSAIDGSALYLTSEICACP